MFWWSSVGWKLHTKLRRHTLHDACNRWWTRPHGSSSRHQSAITSRRSYANYTAESSMAGYKLAVLVYKCLHGLAPSYLADKLHHPAQSEFRTRLRSASSHELSVPRIRLSTYGDRAFSVAAVRIWNSLPQHITSAPSLPVFCSRLKTYSFELCCS